jgi:hypothetical protein
VGDYLHPVGYEKQLLDWGTRSPALKSMVAERWLAIALKTPRYRTKINKVLRTHGITDEMVQLFCGEREFCQPEEWVENCVDRDTPDPLSDAEIKATVDDYADRVKEFHWKRETQILQRSPRQQTRPWERSDYAKREREVP